MGPFLFSCVLDDDENCCSTKRESVLGAGATAPAGRRPENRPEAIRANLSGRAKIKGPLHGALFIFVCPG